MTRPMTPLRLAALFLVLWLPAALSARAFAASPPARDFDVLGYKATLVPDMPTASITGVESIELVVTAHQATHLRFDTGALAVDAVEWRARPLRFSVADKQLVVTLPAPVKRGQRLRLALRYRGAPKHGLEFHADAAQLYTIFSTSQWLVVVDAPDERATLDLTVVLPGDYRMTGNGSLRSKSRTRDGRIAHRWKLREPAPSFAYGFAAGRFDEVEANAREVESRTLSRTLSDAQARQLFAGTGDMLAFFGERSGIAYRGRYDQVLVTDTIGQEAAGFALLSEEYGRALLAGEATEELIAHEAAHQWWGIRTTCRSWGEFWLNEGFANFMAAAYMQHAHGEAAYLASVERWKARLDKLRAEGKDHALVFDRWDKPTRDDRAVVYQKGAYVLHLLRREMGEAAFWKGIRDYSREYSGRSVTTADFQEAMERSSGRDLDGFFGDWVTGVR
jgi:aminopeptidase N